MSSRVVSSYVVFFPFVADVFALMLVGFCSVVLFSVAGDSGLESVLVLNALTLVVILPASLTMASAVADI